MSQGGPEERVAGSGAGHHHPLTARCYAGTMLISHKHVFRSRWRALLWSAGICLTAYCTVPGEGEGDGGLIAGLAQAASDPAEGAATSGEGAPRHTNPWALRPDQPGGTPAP